MQEALEKVTLGDAADAAGRQRAGLGSHQPADIKQRLVEQVTGLVRWRESVQYMKSPASTR
jgi:[acyl-carrier-protein] S-malonyltransferase